MKVVGYFIHGNKQYVAFTDGTGRNEGYKITDGFHDRTMGGKGRDPGDYKRVSREEIDLGKIIRRMRGARPWHPLLEVLREETEE